MRGMELYIGGILADTDGESLVVMNYSFEDLQSPAAVKNSYSNTVKLKGTPNNNRIFGECFRADRTNAHADGGTGAGFNPSVRTPFAIYSGVGEVLESGYAKLDSVKRDGADIEYSVTLYGGLGSFLYSLMYDGDGDKLTLADLDYMGTSDPDGEFDFTISKETVENAWEALRSGSGSDMWRAVNFAPCYNGVPDSDFSADRAVVRPGDVGLPALRTEGETSYGTGTGGFCMVNLSSEHDEWAVKDLRSYMQRPVLSVRAFIRAVCDPSNNGGYEVDVSDLDGGRLPELDAWITLPMLDGLEAPESTADFSPVGGRFTGRYIARYDNSGIMPAGMSVHASLKIVPYFYVPEASGKELKLYGEKTYTASGGPELREGRLSVVFLQAVAYDRNGTPTGASTVHCIAPWADGRLPETYWESPEWLAGKFGYTPACGQGYEEHFDSDDSGFVEDTGKGAGWFRFGGLRDFVSFDLEAPMADNIRIEIACGTATGNGDMLMDWSTSELVLSPALTFMNVIETQQGPTFTTYVAESATAEQYEEPSFETTGETATSYSFGKATKAVILGGLGTPADYLLSFCKMFGLVFLFDGMERKVSIMQRGTFFRDSVTDASGRIDLSREATVEPLVFKAKYYDFGLEGSGGAFEERYQTDYGRAYGMQRVNTGYRFDSNNVDVLSGLSFKAAASVLEYGKYWNVVSIPSGAVLPSVFLDTGNTYTLYDNEGNSEDYTVPCPPYDAVVRYYNGKYRGYDMQGAAKPQFHDADGKPCGGEGVLLYLSGFARYESFKLSDDNGAMAVLNEGKACWDLTPGGGLTAPVFSGFLTGGDGTEVTASLDMGVPSETGVPGLSYPAETTVYARYWKDYITDRYSVDNKVMKCRADLRGLKPGQELLRGFWWFEDSLWVLNSISGYALGSDEPAECEFVQVRDVSAYTRETSYAEFSPSVLEFGAEGGVKYSRLDNSGGKWTIR